MDAFCVGADSMAWEYKNSILLVTDADGTKRSLMTEYVLMTLYDVQKSKEVVLMADSRDTQDSYLMFQCFYNTLICSAKSQICLISDDYHVHLTDAHSGSLLLKIVSKESRIYTTASGIALQAKLTTLNVTIATLRFNILKLNIHVQQIIIDMEICGETAPNVVKNLICTYENTLKQTF